MVRHALALAKAQELAQRQAVGTAPFQPTLAVDALKVTDQQHAEVASRRQRWATTARRILLRTLPLHEPVEVGGDQHRLQLVVEDVSGRARHLTGSPEAVAHLRFPQNVACGFPAPTLFGSWVTALQAPAAPGRGGAG